MGVDTCLVLEGQGIWWLDDREASNQSLNEWQP
jgi:hypothetical protein